MGSAELLPRLLKRLIHVKSCGNYGKSPIKSQVNQDQRWVSLTSVLKGTTEQVLLESISGHIIEKTIISNQHGFT